MSKCIVIILIMAFITFAYGLKPSIGFGVGWSRIVLEHISENAFSAGVSTIATYSENAGITASLFGFSFANDVTLIGFGGRIGFIEMTSGGDVSPYCEQSILLEYLTVSGISSVELGIGISFGLEFSSKSSVNPYLVGGCSYASVSVGDSSTSGFGFSFGVGFRFSWTKSEI